MSIKDRDEQGKIKRRYGPEELRKKGEEYFDTHPDPKEVTIAGMCLYLDMSYNTYKKYLSSDDIELREAAEWLATRLQHKYEMDLNNKQNPTGPIFVLKQKPFGWSDKQDVEVSGQGTFNIISNIPRPKEK